MPFEKVSEKRDKVIDVNRTPHIVSFSTVDCLRIVDGFGNLGRGGRLCENDVSQERIRWKEAMYATFFIQRALLTLFLAAKTSKPI